ncbi:MAG TPA: oligosaccharide flippase family protein [Gemmatimonadaceae bacterium]|nr:oligosaccharide flippase family protein [Gemmatimonadaceae bacterium]
MSAAPPPPPDDEAAAALLGRAKAGARLLTARGVAMRLVSIASNLLLIALVAPADLGLVAVVRGVTGGLAYATELGLAGALVRRRVEPTREEYAALAGLQGVILLAAIAAAWAFPSLALGGGSVGARWRPWMLATMATMVFVPLGTGARVRLERALDYRRLAFLDVTSVLVQNVGLLVAAFSGHFTEGVFIVHAFAYVYLYGLAAIWSPGPLPTLRARGLGTLLRDSATFSLAACVDIARGYATPVLVAMSFGLPVAGVWSFAERVGQVLKLAFEGYRRAGVPIAPRLAHDRVALRRLVSDMATGAARFTAPAAAGAIALLPVVAMISPKWAPAVGTAQLWVFCLAVAGVANAALEPVAVAIHGPRVTLTEQGVAAVATWAALAVVATRGSHAVWVAVVPLHLASLTVLLAWTARDMRPRWTREMTRLVGALAASAAVTTALGIAGASPLVRVAGALAAAVVVLPPAPYLAMARRLWARLFAASAGGDAAAPADGATAAATGPAARAA